MPAPITVASWHTTTVNKVNARLKSVISINRSGPARLYRSKSIPITMLVVGALVSDLIEHGSQARRSYGSGLGYVAMYN
jgi:hypothetical protein